ncbi:MAG: glycosyltransferase family 39 protein [Cephaloticoccus sp.]|nr:glycosyltransferase family 39 protein [Cephaloticoccus sp.]
MPSWFEAILFTSLFVGALVFGGWGMSVGWESKTLPGVEYRQAQTALSVFFIDQENDFSLAYPTPVLGKPWSIPMEFPLYQWAVVITSRATGLGLTQAGRAVSIACFFLTLPAVFLLLGRWQVAPSRRWIVLALIVSCPLYIFYARAFLIETMALMFALWFWVGFERAVTTREARWLILAVLAGSGAGLVKVTTFMLYLIPMTAWAFNRLWCGRENGSWRTDFIWMAAVVPAPLFLAGWWVWWADQIKALNPVADFLNSTHMKDFNLGNRALRFSAEIWAMQWRIVRDQLTWLPLLGLGFLGLLLGARHRVQAVLFCGSIFMLALWCFPLLYAYHDYYYVANTMALLLAVGLAVVGLTENVQWRWLGTGMAGLFVLGQMFWYGWHYLPAQQGISAGGNVLTVALQQLTAPRDVLLVVGQDWNSMTPYYAQRRALMLRVDAETDATKIDQALLNLSAENIGALVVESPSWREKSLLLERLGRLGLSNRPLLRDEDDWLFFREDQETRITQLMLDGKISGFVFAPGVRPEAKPLAGAWQVVAELPLDQQLLFTSMHPQPGRFFSTFEPMRQRIAQMESFSMHPLTRLVFHLPPGQHALHGVVWINPDAYHPPPGQDPTDGVELRLSELIDSQEPRLLNTRLIDPTNREVDRGPVPIEFLFSLERDSDVELMLGPGPSGRDTRDWAWLRGPVTIE